MTTAAAANPDLKRVIKVLARNTRLEPGETRDSAWISVPHPLTPEESQSIPDDDLLTINQLGPVALAALRAAYPYNGESPRLQDDVITLGSIIDQARQRRTRG